MQQYEKFMKSIPVIPDVAVKILSIAEDKIEISFKALSILRKGVDGSWKLYCDIWNSDAPLPPKGS